ncbi:hypothetical protein ACFLZK_01345 [Patescibacteria group bacterium]
MDDNAKKQIEDLAKRIEDAESSLNAAKRILNRLNEDYLKVDYTQIEGIVGKYNGVCMEGEDGKEYDVSPNYAAKSKLVFGDVLKLIDEDGKKLFKQIERVKRERVEGILTKKEGEWYLLTDRGSYRVSDAAAEFQKADLNSQASAFLPADNLNAPFATLDSVEGASVIKGSKKEDTKEKKVKEKKEDRADNLKEMKSKEIDLKKEKVEKVEEKKAPVKRAPAPAKRPPARPKPAQRSAPRQSSRPAPRPARRPPAKRPPAKREAPRKEAPPATEQKPVEQDDLV